MGGSQTAGPRRRRILVAGGLLIAIGLVAVGVWLRPARVEGETPADRARSVCRLADTRPWGSYGALARAARDESDARVREAAYVGLARFTDRRECRTVVEAGLDDPEPAVRAAAASSLGEFADPGVAEQLERLLADRAPEVRRGAVEGLKRHGGPESLVSLLEAAQNNADPEVQYKAICALYRRCGMRYTGPRPELTDRWPVEAGIATEFLKEVPCIQEAYKALGRPLHLRPEFYTVPVDEPDPRAQGGGQARRSPQP